MRTQLTSCLLALLVSATSACAQFEGLLALKLTLVAKDGTERPGGAINLALAKAGMRGEITQPLGPGVDLKTVVLCLTASPNTNYLINDANRTFTAIDLSPPTATPSQSQDQATWTIEKLGQEPLLGYPTQHVLARPKPGPGQSMELWVATDFLDADTFRQFQACSGGGAGEAAGLARALKAAGAEGMPLKVVITTPAGLQVRLEAVQAQKQSLPASTFQIPPGYTQWVDGTTVAAGPEAAARQAQLQEARKKLEEQIQQLPPKQRAVLQKLLESRQVR